MMNREQRRKYIKQIKNSSLAGKCPKCNNISRFFTTVRFFTEAGVNFPEIFKCLALNQELSISPGSINPLQNGLMWVRGMDREPLLIVNQSIEKEIIFL